MDIYFLRHANAGEPKANPAKDEKRPIDKLGIEQSHDVGRALAALDVNPDVIISSPLRRATQTAAVVANEWDAKTRSSAMPRSGPMRAMRSSRNCFAATAGGTPSWWSATIPA